MSVATLPLTHSLYFPLCTPQKCSLRPTTWHHQSLLPVTYPGAWEELLLCAPGTDDRRKGHR